MIERIYKLCLTIVIKSEVWTISHCSGLGHETMVCAICLYIFLWICDMAWLLRGTFVSWWYLPRIWPSVTDMQHYYHARYPSDDWHLAYMFLLVFLPWKCAWKACFPILLAQGEILHQGLCTPHSAPPTPPPPPPPPPHPPPPPPLARKNKIEQGWPGSPLATSEGAFELTHQSACIIGW